MHVLNLLLNLVLNLVDVDVMTQTGTHVSVHQRFQRVQPVYSTCEYTRSYGRMRRYGRILSLEQPTLHSLLAASLLSLHGPRVGQDWSGDFQGRLGAAHPCLRPPRVPGVGGGGQLGRRVLV